MVHWTAERSWPPKLKRRVCCSNLKDKDAQLPAFIASYMKRKGVDMEPKATVMLADFVGSDLSRLTGELEIDYYFTRRTETCYSRTD